MFAEKEFTELGEEAKAYLETRLQLARLQVVARTSVIAAAGLSKFILLACLFLFLLFISFALAAFIEERTGSEPAGYLVAASLYLLAAGVYYFFLRKKQEEKIRDKMIQKMLRDETGD